MYFVVVNMLEGGRSSRRLSIEKKEEEILSDESEDLSWGADDGTPAPVDDAAWSREDQAWRKFSINKFVYFRWSTGFNSKNRFKGIVTDHVSRLGPKGIRIDYLTIKTFGISEDRYRMGKDIRELLVLPNKTSLMETRDEDELRRHAIRRWGSREPGNGWVDSFPDSTISTEATTPITTSVKLKAARKVQSRTIVKAQQVKKRFIPNPTSVRVELPQRPKDGVWIHGSHRTNTLAGGILSGRFSFFN